MMKKMNYVLMTAVMAVMIGLTSCGVDEVPPLVAPGAPTLTVTVAPEATDYLPGTELVYTIVATPAEGSSLSTLTITPSIDGDGGASLGSYLYKGTETVEYSYTVPFEGNANVNINFSVTAINPEDPRLDASASTDKTFGVIESFSEVASVKLFNLYGDSNAKSMLRWDTHETFSYQESYDGDDDLKLAIDIFAYTKIDTVDGEAVETAFLLGTGGIVAGQTAVWVSWGDGDFKAKRGLDCNPASFTVYNQLNYDAFLPEDIFLGSSASGLTVEVGDVITFDNAFQGNYAPLIYPLYHQRTNDDIIGAIQIDEINFGTIGDGSDGYIVFSYKYVAK